jgi:hypothetical protein
VRDPKLRQELTRADKAEKIVGLIREAEARM